MSAQFVWRQLHQTFFTKIKLQTPVLMILPIDFLFRGENCKSPCRENSIQQRRQRISHLTSHPKSLEVLIGKPPFEYKNHDYMPRDACKHMRLRTAQREAKNWETGDFWNDVLTKSEWYRPIDKYSMILTTLALWYFVRVVFDGPSLSLSLINFYESLLLCWGWNNLILASKYRINIKQEQDLRPVPHILTGMKH